MIFKICCPVVVQQVLHSFKINIVTCPGDASKITVIVSHYCNGVLFFCKNPPHISVGSVISVSHIS